jgi:hypothetical protein
MVCLKAIYINILNIALLVFFLELIRVHMLEQESTTRTHTRNTLEAPTNPDALHKGTPEIRKIQRNPWIPLCRDASTLFPDSTQPELTMTPETKTTIQDPEQPPRRPAALWTSKWIRRETTEAHTLEPVGRG